MQPKDLLLAPLYLYQGNKLKRTALRLPEAQGERQGQLILAHSKPNAHNASEERGAFKTDANLQLMVVGDSSAAGVGVKDQKNALIGHLLENIKTSDIVVHQFDSLEWSLHATSGHTSFDVLHRLYVLPKPKQSIDIMTVVVGVNDTTKSVPLEQWQYQLQEIITLAKRKFGAKHIIFSCLPPMAMMPAIPTPLNQFIGAKSDAMDKILQQVCHAHHDTHYLSIDFATSGLDNTRLFADDGFHPSNKAYEYWAKELCELIEGIVDNCADDTTC